MTRCQILCSMRFQCVSKILTPRRMLKTVQRFKLAIGKVCGIKIVGDQFFVTPHIFANRTHFVTLDRLQATKTGSKLCCTPLS